MGHLQSQREISMETEQTWADRCLQGGEEGFASSRWFLPCHHNLPPMSIRAMFEPLGVPFVKKGDGPAFVHLSKG